MAPNKKGFQMSMEFSVDPDSIKSSLGTLDKQIQEFTGKVGSRMGELDRVFADGFKGFKSFSSIVTTISENTARLGKSFDMLSGNATKIKASSEALSHLATGMASFNDISKVGMSNFKTLNATASELATGLKNLGNVKLDKAGENIKNIGTIVNKIDPASVKTFKDLAKGVNSLSLAFEKMPDAAEINAKGEAIKGMTDTTIGGLFKNIGEIRAKTLVVDEFTAKKGRGSFGNMGGSGGSGDGTGSPAGPTDDLSQHGFLMKVASVTSLAVITEILKRGEVGAYLAQKEGGTRASDFFGAGITAPGSKADTLGSVLTDFKLNNKLVGNEDAARIITTLTATARNNTNVVNPAALTPDQLLGQKGTLQEQVNRFGSGVTGLSTGLGMDMNAANQIGGMVMKNALTTTAAWERISQSMVKMGQASGTGAEGIAALTPQMINFAISTGQVGTAFETAARDYLATTTSLMAKGLSAGQAGAFKSGAQSGTFDALAFDLMAGITDPNDPQADAKRTALQKKNMGMVSGNKMLAPYLYQSVLPGAMKGQGLQDWVSAQKFNNGEALEKIKAATLGAEAQPTTKPVLAPSVIGNALFNVGTGIINMLGEGGPKQASFSERMPLTGRATGGMVTGEEQGKFGDSVLTRLTPGEYVLPKGETKELIYKMADKYGLDKNTFYNQIKAESNFDPKARSKAGAMGLGQLMPATARALGVKNPYNPAQNLEGSAKHMANLLGKYGGNYSSALAAYNEGETAFNKGKMPTETRNYVSKILGRTEELFSSTTNGIQQAVVSTQVMAASSNKELTSILSSLTSVLEDKLTGGKMDSAADGLIQAAQLMVIAVAKMSSVRAGLVGNGTVESLARGMAPYASWR